MSERRNTRELEEEHVERGREVREEEGGSEDERVGMVANRSLSSKLCVVDVVVVGPHGRSDARS